jgi:hypothetical protein
MKTLNLNNRLVVTAPNGDGGALCSGSDFEGL